MLCFSSPIRFWLRVSAQRLLQVLFCSFLAGCILAPASLHAQALPMRTVATMPGAIVETSGLIYTGPNRLWTHNDSGGEPKLYQIDTTGAILRTLVVRSVLNIDWEDLCQDAAGNVYIGDFGNNNNDRTNLVILKLPPLDTVVGDTVDAMRIDYAYPDQFAFPPVDALKNFDMEAFVALGDSLYLFSKNRTIPFDGYTKMYRLPQTPGNYTAELIDSFYTGPGPTLNYWICGAALSPGNDHLVLVSYARCFIFSCFQGADFFGGAVVQRTWAFTQKEAAAWRDSSHMYLSDELLNQTLGGKLYEANMSALIQLPDAYLGPDTVHAGDTLWLFAPSNPGGSQLWSTGATTASLPITQAGSYWLEATAANGCKARDTIVVSLVAQSALPFATAIKVFPNPMGADSRITIHAPGATDLQWRLIDAWGQTIQSGAIGGTMDDTYQVDLAAQLPAGIYYLEMGTDAGKASIKLLRQAR